MGSNKVDNPYREELRLGRLLEKQLTCFLEASSSGIGEEDLSSQFDDGETGTVSIVGVISRVATWTRNASVQCFGLIIICESTILRKSFQLSLFAYSSLKIAKRGSSSAPRSASMEVLRWGHCRMGTN